MDVRKIVDVVALRATWKLNLTHTYDDINKHDVINVLIMAVADQDFCLRGLEKIGALPS